jgi:hypothetical protein
MRTSNMPQNLPMLPGNVYADPTVTRYHKTQLLGIKDGAICGKLPFLDPTQFAEDVTTWRESPRPFPHALAHLFL